MRWLSTGAPQLQMKKPICLESSHGSAYRRNTSITTGGSVCLPRATAAGQTFGADRGLTNPLSDIPHTRVIILAGTNIAECQPTIMPYFDKAKENGAYIIAIDPRETATTKIADLHLKIKPGTDATLANGLVKICIDEQLTDKDFIRTRTNGFNKLKRHTDALDLKEISEQTSVPLEHIRKAAVKFAKETSGMLFTARGSNSRLTVPRQ